MSRMCLWLAIFYLELWKIVILNLRWFSLMFWRRDRTYIWEKVASYSKCPQTSPYERWDLWLVAASKHTHTHICPLQSHWCGAHSGSLHYNIPGPCTWQCMCTLLVGCLLSWQQEHWLAEWKSIIVKALLSNTVSSRSCVSSGGAPTLAGTSMFTMWKKLCTHEVWS